MGEDLGGALGLIIILFGFVIAILWILLPFAVFGIKSRLDQIAATHRIINQYLPDIAFHLATMAESMGKPAANDDYVGKLKVDDY